MATDADRPPRDGGEPKSSPGQPHALEENVAAIRGWEQAALRKRSRLSALSERVIVIAASGPVLILHMVWFAVWILGNTGRIPGFRSFDPFPFPFLTLVVSLEAIFLSLLVLSSQNRLTQVADKRAKLDLQIDLLAEREMTAVLQLLRDISTHLKVPVSVTSEQVRDLAKKTDIADLTTKLDHEDEEDAAADPARGR